MDIKHNVINVLIAICIPLDILIVLIDFLRVTIQSIRQNN